MLPGGTLTEHSRPDFAARDPHPGKSRALIERDWGVKLGRSRNPTGRAVDVLEHRVTVGTY
jgi:hypothetical protein